LKQGFGNGKPEVSGIVNYLLSNEVDHIGGGVPNRSSGHELRTSKLMRKN
jgi:hypothetical protein